MVIWQGLVMLGTAAAVVASSGARDADSQLAGAGALGLLGSAALVRRGGVVGVLRRQPHLVVLGSGAVGCLVVLDGAGPTSPFFGVSLPLLGLAAVLGPARRVALCAALTVAGLLIATAMQEGVAISRWPGDVPANIAAVIALSTALALFFGAFRSTVRDAESIVLGARAGAPASSPAMQARLSGRAPAAALPRADPAPLLDLLTEAERQVVRRLAQGRAAKQIAVERGVALATVRVQIRAAKRKTGARTLSELIALAATAERRSSRNAA